MISAVQAGAVEGMVPRAALTTEVASSLQDMLTMPVETNSCSLLTKLSSNFGDLLILYKSGDDTQPVSFLFVCNLNLWNW